MNKIIQDAIANILFNKLMEYFHDIENVGLAIRSSKEFEIIMQLEGIITSNIEESIDHKQIIKIWNDLYFSIKQVNEEYETFIEIILKRFDIFNNDYFMIIGSLEKYENYIESFLSCEEKNIYSEYLKNIREIILNFKKDLLHYYKEELFNNFFNNRDIINSVNIKYSEPYKINEKTVYLDQNVISNILKEKKKKELFLEISKSKEFSFVYSPYLIEDAINMNLFFFKEYKEFLIELTNCKMVVLEGQKTNFVKEEFKDTYTRVEKYSYLRNTYEKARYMDILINYYTYPRLRKGSVINKQLSKNIISFFKDNKEIDRFELTGHKIYSHHITHFLKKGELNLTSEDDTVEIIYELLELFDFINYKTENINISNLKKIYSSYRDNSHIVYAYECDYFLTNDDKLSHRANTVYELINAKTKVLKLEDFIKKT